MNQSNNLSESINQSVYAKPRNYLIIFFCLFIGLCISIIIIYNRYLVIAEYPIGKYRCDSMENGMIWWWYYIEITPYGVAIENKNGETTIGNWKYSPDTKILTINKIGKYKATRPGTLQVILENGEESDMFCHIGE